jgi:hypothetical protein
MSKYNYEQFKKKDLVRIYKGMISFYLQKFGYSNRPYLIETRLPDEMFAAVIKRNNRYAILYDYKQFRDSYKDKGYKTNQLMAFVIITHEMRHYYQIRQIFSKTPRVDEKTLAEWRKDYYSDEDFGDEGCKTTLDYFLQPMELDAELYAYVLAGKVLDRVPLYPDDYVKRLREKYVEMFGEDDEFLYLFDKAITFTDKLKREEVGASKR